MSNPYPTLLAGGDRRSIGAANTAVTQITKNPAQFTQLWECLCDPDPLVRMRAADALEKLSRHNPRLFDAHKGALLDGHLDDGTAELRWHLIPIASRLQLTPDEAQRFFRYLDTRLRLDRSRIVKTTCLQAAHDLVAHHPDLTPLYEQMHRLALNSSHPALSARARKLTPKPTP